MTDDNTNNQRKRIPQSIFLIIVFSVLVILLIMFANKKLKKNYQLKTSPEKELSSGEGTDTAVNQDIQTASDSSIHEKEAVREPEVSYETKSDASLSSPSFETRSDVSAPAYETSSDQGISTETKSDASLPVLSSETKTDMALPEPSTDVNALSSNPVTDTAALPVSGAAEIVSGEDNKPASLKEDGVRETGQISNAETKKAEPLKHNLEFEVFQLNGSFIEKTDKIDPAEPKKNKALSEIIHTIKDSFFVRENKNINGWLMVETKMTDKTGEKARTEVNMRKYYYSGTRDDNGGILLTNYKMENTSNSPVLFSSIPWKLTGSLEKGFTYNYKNTIDCFKSDDGILWFHTVS